MACLIEAKTVKNRFPYWYALIKDHVLVWEGKEQLYGTSWYYANLNKKQVLSPVFDRKNLNKRRLALGLDPIEEYLSRERKITKL